MNTKRPEKIKKWVASRRRTQTLVRGQMVPYTVTAAVRYTYTLFSELLNIIPDWSNLGVTLSRTIEL